MLFSDAVFNKFAGVFDVLNDVRQNCYGKPRCYYSCPYAVMRNLDAIIRDRMLLCETSMPVFVFRIMFFLIWVFRELEFIIILLLLLLLLLKIIIFYYYYYY